MPLGGPPEEEGKCHLPYSRLVLRLVLLVVLTLVSSQRQPTELRHYLRSLLLRSFRSHLCCRRGLLPCCPLVP